MKHYVCVSIFHRAADECSMPSSVLFKFLCLFKLDIQGIPHSCLISLLISVDKSQRHRYGHRVAKRPIFRSHVNVVLCKRFVSRMFCMVRLNKLLLSRARGQQLRPSPVQQ